MNRRHFLAAALAAAAPLFVATAFAADPAPTDVDALSAAFQRARMAGRPLLVIVIPSDEAALWDRGTAWGELLNFGNDDTMARLGQVEVVCAHDAAVRAFAPQAAGAEPWFWVIPTATMRAAVVPGTPELLPALADDEAVGLNDRDDTKADARIDTQIAHLAAALSQALPPLPRGADERAALRTRAVIGLRTAAPANTHWANGGGCGTEVEGVENNVAYGCGMGYLPARARRFLYFFDIEKYKRGELF